MAATVRSATDTPVLDPSIRSSQTRERPIGHDLEPFDTAAALTATKLLRAGHPWTAVHAIHAARPSAGFPAGRYLLALEPELYDGTGVQAVHPDH
ncbi:hypothetical protein [Streptomyces sp. NPDC002990]